MVKKNISKDSILSTLKEIAKERFGGKKLTKKKKKAHVIGRIPFSLVVNQSVVNLKPLVEFSNDAVSQKIRGVWEKIQACF